MCTLTFLNQHRNLEVKLDELLLTLKSPTAVIDCFRAAYAAAADHYVAEDHFFRGLLPQFPEALNKMIQQHSEALEIAAHAEDSLNLGQTSDALHLIRRFHAIAQHNIIEEERDVFPLLATGIQ